MARKITLTVPDNLYVAIDRWRSSFNLSRIFQDAMADAIRRKEEFQKRLTQEHSLTEIIQRLRREKSTVEQRTVRAASDAGRAWAQNAHYSDLVSVVNASVEEIPQLPATIGVVSGIVAELSAAHGNEFTSEDELRSAVLSGWRQGVCDLWETVRDRL